MAERLINEIRRKYPNLSKKSKTGACSAIRLFCLEFMGGSRGLVLSCSTTECPLHNFRLGSRPDTMNKILKNRESARSSSP